MKKMAMDSNCARFLQGKLPRGHPLLHGLSGRTIAVKRLKPISDLPEAIVSYFTREKQVMSGLQQHQNVIRLLAYCEEGRERILVYEYMHRRSLDAYIFGTHTY
jgi:serine/threonine protein kinase